MKCKAFTCWLLLFLRLNGFAPSLRLRRDVSLMISCFCSRRSVSGPACSLFLPSLWETATLVGVSLYSLSSFLGLTGPGPVLIHFLRWRRCILAGGLEHRSFSLNLICTNVLTWVVGTVGAFLIMLLYRWQESAMSSSVEGSFAGVRTASSSFRTSS